MLVNLHVFRDRTQEERRESVPFVILGAIVHGLQVQ